MIDEEKYLNSINNYIKRNMEKDKIKNGIIADYLNKKISIETFDKAIDLLDGKEEKKVITNLKTRIKVITNPEEQEKALKQVMGHHKIDVLDIENDERQ